MLARAQGAVTNGHAVGIMEIAPISLLAKRQEMGNVPVWAIPYLDAPTLFRFRTWISFARSVLQFQAVVREFKPDIVSVNFPMWQSLPVVGAFYFPHRWRLVVTLHGSDIAAVPIQQPKVRSWQRRLLRRADRVIAVSHSLLEQASNLYPFLRDKSEVIPNGLAPEWFESASEQPPKGATRYVLYVGRLDRVKGVDLLLRAWSQLADQMPGELWLAGDGPERKALQDLAVSLKIADRVQFLGRLQREKLRALYRNTEFVVLPSRREGLSWVTLEAGACGAICIATMVGGSVEVIEHEKTGFLVATESPEALARGMLRALRLRPPDLDLMKHAARQRIRNHFSNARMRDRYEHVYCSLAGRSDSEKARDTRQD